MAPGILNKLRRRQSTSPHRPHSYVHHVSTTPEWPTSPAQVTPDVYLTSPEEQDGLLTSVCVHRAIEHEPKRLRKEGKHDSNTPPVAAASALAAALASVDDPTSPVSDGPPVFRRSSLPTPDIVLPKKPSEVLREAAKRNFSSKDKLGARYEVTETNAQGDANTGLIRVSSGRDANEGLGGSKSKSTLRHRASKVIKSFTHRDNSEKRVGHQEPKTKSPKQHKRRNTLSDSSQSAFNMLAQTSTAHAVPQETSAENVPSSPPPGGSAEGGRRRSSTLGHVEFTPRPDSPPRPPLPGDKCHRSINPKCCWIAIAPVITLEPAAEIDSPVDPAVDSSTGGKSKKLQRRRSKNAFSHLFTLKSEKIFRSPPPTKPSEEPIPPVPSIPEELAKAVADPDTPEASQSSRSPSTPTATPKSSKSKRFRRHRRATIDSVSQLPSDITGTPSPTAPQSETPKTPTTPRIRTFTIVDLRKGFQVRGLGKGKGKLFSAKSNPEIRSPSSTQELTQASESRENLESTQRHRPPPLQPTESPHPGLGFPIAINGTFFSIESTGPVTPVFGALETPAPVPESVSAPVVEPSAKTSSSTEGEPDLSYSATTDEGEQTQRPSSASEATLLSDDPLFTVLSAPSTLGDLQLQLREPSTKTSTLDAHLRIGSLRFEDFSFDTNVF
ncbi:hypothetical protein RHS01_02599 [Rhizoctonia solani]|uniref:Uncharacterized protein n=1 Tax=Rhizoctonia solani TaxID=456999 RepID=A0A8H7IL52_9AGAM|nr:hypothetical protein RHS01_02599 [Rhizoctonia solani]